MIARWMFACFLCAFEIVAGSLLVATLSAEESRTPPDPGPTPVTRQEVWQAVVAALRERGLSEARLPRIEDLDLPGALPAVAGRTLRVTSACWEEGPERTQFRLECGEPGQCLPFLVYVHVHNEDEGNRDAGARAGACRPASESRPAAQAALKLPARPTVRAGDRATAVFVSDRLRITASVTCLERGREGEVIRVRSQEGQVFRARISGPALLEALPQ
ncbi:MAG: flagella basal body P-ring formation protein FlgA [Terriglobales bacterium]